MAFIHRANPPTGQISFHFDGANSWHPTADSGTEVGQRFNSKTGRVPISRAELIPPQGFFQGLNLSGVRACWPVLVRRVLWVAGSGMKSHCASAPVPPEPLQPVQHEKIKRMNGEPLALLDRVLRW
jgi:hypothetical protein